MINRLLIRIKLLINNFISHRIYVTRTKINYMLTKQKDLLTQVNSNIFSIGIIIIMFVRLSRQNIAKTNNIEEG